MNNGKIAIDIEEYKKLLNTKLIAEKNILINVMSRGLLDKNNHNPELIMKIENQIQETESKLYTLDESINTTHKHEKITQTLIADKIRAYINANQIDEINLVLRSDDKCFTYNQNCGIASILTDIIKY